MKSSVSLFTLLAASLSSTAAAAECNQANALDISDLTSEILSDISSFSIQPFPTSLAGLGSSLEANLASLGSSLGCDFNAPLTAANACPRAGKRKRATFSCTGNQKCYKAGDSENALVCFDSGSGSFQAPQGISGNAYQLQYTSNGKPLTDLGAAAGLLGAGGLGAGLGGAMASTTMDGASMTSGSATATETDTTTQTTGTGTESVAMDSASDSTSATAVGNGGNAAIGISAHVLGLMAFVGVLPLVLAAAL